VNVYHAYGLCIRSELPLPEVAPWHPDPAGLRTAGDPADVDVQVRIGAVMRSLGGRTIPGFPWQVRTGQYLLTIDGVARFLITGGRDVTIDPAPSGAWEDIRGYFLGAVCGVLLHTCGVLPLHGSSIATPRGAMIFLGRSGSGKSTLLSTLLRRGHTMIADDVTAVRIGDDGTPLAYPGYPRIRLFDSVLRGMGEQPDTLQRLSSASGKYLLPVDRFASTPAPVTALFELVETDAAGLSIDDVPPAEQLVRCGQFIRTRRLFPGHEDVRQRFAGLGALLRTAALRRIVRPRHPFHPDALADLIEGLGVQEAQS